MAKVLIAGCGYVGAKLASDLCASGHEVYVVKREPVNIDGVDVIAADLTQPATLKLPEIDAAIFTAAPDSSDEAAYRSVYVDGLRHLKNALRGQPRLLFTSSTAVYGQDDGCTVDETSPTVPENFRGQVLLEAERLASVVLRLSGIYGPGRARALDRVRAGNARYRPGRISNLVHRDDAAGALGHLVTLPDPDPLYVGVDEEPVVTEELYRWLARRTGSVMPRAESGARGRNKRCSSRKLRGSGYRFRYPTFRDGYGELTSIDGLPPCPSSPNCVSTHPSEASPVAALRFTTDSEEARAAIEEAVHHAGGRVCSSHAGYVRAEFTSRIFRFVDDVEFRIVTSTGGVELRSASRVGYYDFGVNRRRVRELTRILDRGGKIVLASKVS